MIKFCLNKWNKNKCRLEDAIKKDKKLNSCEYEHLVKLVVNYILNDEDSDFDNTYDAEKITIIDNGYYQGTQLFMIPKKMYAPDEYDYLLTFCDYGSCSGCDTLQSIQGWNVDMIPTEEQAKDYMTLCKDLVCNMVRPYNYGWRKSELYSVVEEYEKE